jgi:hypothetical protein
MRVSCFFGIACLLLRIQYALDMNNIYRSRRDRYPTVMSSAVRMWRRSALRNRVLFLEAGLQILEVHRNAGL